MFVSTLPPSSAPAQRPLTAAAKVAPAPAPAAAPAGDKLSVTTAAPTHRDGAVAATDGKPVGFRTTEPAGTPKAIVVMQQGTYGQPQFFDGMGEKLAAQGIKSYAVGSRVETTTSTIHADDLDAVVAKARAENPGVPVTVMGVSLGAMIALDWNTRHNAAHVPVVLMSPVVLPKYLGFGDLCKVALGLFSKHFAAAKVESPMSKGARLTTNPASTEDHLPDAKAMKVPANLFDDVVKMAARGAWHGRSSTGPLLVLEAGNDQVAANWATGPFMHLIGSKTKTVKKLPGAAHDLSQEYHRADVTSSVADWVLGRR